MLRGLPATLEMLRRDRLLAHAVETNGDPLALARLFRLSFPAAVHYCAQLGLLDDVTAQTVRADLPPATVARSQVAQLR
jgi:hypothetical protein